MRSLLAKLSLLSLGVGASLAGLTLAAAMRDYDGDPSFICAVVDKARRLKSLGSPKALFIGGSNLAFNQDSRRLEAVLGRPAFNLGLHASIGLSWMLAQAEAHLGPGDLAVVVPEFEQFQNVYEGGVTLTQLLLTYPEGFRFLRSWRQLRTIPEAIIPRLETNLFWRLKKRRVLAEFKADPWYRRDAFDERGDVVAHLRPDAAGALRLAVEKERRAAAGRRPAVMEAFDDEAKAVRGLNVFAAVAGSRGARTVMAFPCISRTTFEANAGALRAFESRLRSELAMPLLGPVADCVLEPALFLDSAYHLLPEGRARNTERLASLLTAGGYALPAGRIY